MRNYPEYELTVYRDTAAVELGNFYRSLDRDGEKVQRVERMGERADGYILYFVWLCRRST